MTKEIESEFIIFFRNLVKDKLTMKERSEVYNKFREMIKKC